MRTLLAVCLDESGSMDVGGKRAAAISAFNEYLGDQQKLKADECLLALTKFNTTAWTMVPLTHISEVAPLSTATYNPSGGTALLDAVAQTIQTIERHIKIDTVKCDHCGQTKAALSDRVVVVILTDGEENSSRAHTLEGVKALIRAREATGHWTFVFLSASPTAWQQGAALGIQVGNTFKWADTAQGTQQAIHNMSMGTNMYRSASATSSASFLGSTQGNGTGDVEDKTTVTTK